MINRDVIYLVAEGSHGVFDADVETNRKVLCSVSSVGYREFYAAKNAGVEPSIVFTIQGVEYGGEKLVIYNDKRFRVVRTYRSGKMLELTCEEATNDR